MLSTGLMCSDNWRKIPISRIDLKKGEQPAQACVIAFYEKVIKVKADVAAYLR